MLRWISALVILCASHSSYAIDIQKDTLYPQVEFDTSLGKIVVELDRTRAPITVDNFLTYVVKGEYN
ncbi:MAG: peptidylprolyl isomerase, partial [Shewanella sp.]